MTANSSSSVGVPSATDGPARREAGRIRLLIVDEHPLLRAGVRTLLERRPEVEVVGEADTIGDAMRAIGSTEPDVVLLDLDAATVEVVSEMRRLREEAPRSALVVMARHDDDEELFRAIVAGAAGHVSERAQPDELVATIKDAAAGNEPIRTTLRRRPSVGRRVIEAWVELRGRGPIDEPDGGLSDRELEVLSHAASGMTNQQIGRELGVSERTVKGTFSQILGRLGLRHRTEAVVHALRRGWIRQR